MADGSYGCGVNGISMRHTQNPESSVYLDYASAHVPRNFSDAIDWSEHVFTLTDELGDGIKKLYGYFLTPLQSVNITEKELQEADIQHEQKMLLMLDQQLDYPGHAFQVGLNTAVYGNDFITATLSHTRQVVCKTCRTSIVIKESQQAKQIKLRFDGNSFVGSCINPNCQAFGRSASMDYVDTVQRDAGAIIIKHWPIRELEFDYREARDKLQIYWRIPNRIKQLVDKNDLMTLHDYDFSILQAAKQDKLFLFNDSVMFHAKHPTLSGLLVQGLGLPRTLLHARPHWLLQLLNKQCQVIANSYVNPIPFFSPLSNASGVGDVLHGTDQTVVGSIVENMVSRSKRQPGTFHYVPFPVQFQYAAGQADQFVPTELLKYMTDRFTNNLVPMGLLKGDINNQAAPFFLRMFESINREIPHLYNRFLWWLIARVCSMLQMETVSLMHTPSSINDNTMIDQMLMQMSASGKISDTSWMNRLRMNVPLERSRMLAEQRGTMELQQEVQGIQEELGVIGQVGQLAGQGAMAALQPPQQGDPSQGGDPAAAGMAPLPGQLLLPTQGYQPPQDIMQMEADANMLAQMLGGMDSAGRRRELAALQSNSPAMHAMVTKALETLRDQTAMQGRQQLAPTL
jgi:hypothetical protein